MKSRFAFILAAAAAALLTGCGGGEATPDEAMQLAGGIYTGTLEDANTGTTHAVEGAIDETGRVVLVDVTNPTVYLLNIHDFQTRLDDTFSACYQADTFAGATFPDGQTRQHGRVDGQFNNDTATTTGHVIGPKDNCLSTTDNAPSSPFTMSRNTQLYEYEVNYGLLEGAYTFPLKNLTLTWQVDAAGFVNGTDNAGCTYDGPFTIVQSGANAFRVDVQRRCPGYGANTLEGMAYIVPETPQEPQRLWLAFYANYAGLVKPERQAPTL